MHITRAVVKNYRCLETADVELHPELNVIVGNNECGKSTLVEAVYLALTGQLNGRPIQTELHPHLFNAQAVASYREKLVARQPAQPPSILIELYFHDTTELAKLKGTINTLRQDVPGVSLLIELNPEFAADFEKYVAKPEEFRALPIEYYVARWRGFTDNDILSARSIPIKPAMIDASTIRNNAAASRYVVDIMKETLTTSQTVELGLSYRMMKDLFLADPRVKGINDVLGKKKGEITEKRLSVSLDTSARASWETGVIPLLDDIPLLLAGKGEQSAIKIKLALDSSSKQHLVLIEEAENHLSFSALNNLISHIGAQRQSRQLLVTTHSSFVLNKLGVESVILFHRGSAITLKSLTPDTQDYFMRLPGHDTLRLILSKKSILVEGPSDELIVQAAYKKRHGKLPLEDGIDVISVNSLAFKRFLEIADKLGRAVVVVTDNDGKPAKVKDKYKPFDGNANIKICYDPDASLKTLEPQLLKANGLGVVGSILGKTFANDDAALDYMQDNKADSALKFFSTDISWNVPDYIERAIS